MSRRVLVTGAAGFIGYHLSERLLRQGDEVVGLDNLNDYYDVKLKEARLERLQKNRAFRFLKTDLGDRTGVEKIWHEVKPEVVVHLAAQAGVRYSLTHPHAYARSNLEGMLDVLEACRAEKTGNLIFASSSSVYGLNQSLPFSERDNVDHPVSLYAATKKANELMAHSYAHLYGIPCTGLRFFTVYGPWGRPDMAYYKFTRAILEGKEIELYGDGKMQRDFTYVDDIVEAVARLTSKPAVGNPKWDGKNPDPATSLAPYRIYNIGNNSPVELARFVSAIEAATGKKAKIVKKPVPPGDVLATAAKVDDLAAAVDFRPKTSIEEGIQKFVDWYRGYAGL
ncbi:MAG: NAD-dependent epimerase [Verrucomicrobia bacterium]|nr:NAD-dependent epimerase [Verrucomicrobiota bacterium]